MPSSPLMARGGFPGVRLQRGSGPTRWVWVAILQTSDGRANITIQAAPTVANDLPAAFLAKKNRLRAVQASDAPLLRGFQLQGRQSLVRPLQLLEGIGPLLLINYPAREERAWDDIVIGLACRSAASRCSPGPADRGREPWASVAASDRDVTGLTNVLEDGKQKRWPKSS